MRIVADNLENELENRIIAKIWSIIISSLLLTGNAPCTNPTCVCGCVIDGINTVVATGVY